MSSVVDVRDNMPTACTQAHVYIYMHVFMSQAPGVFLISRKTSLAHGLGLWVKGCCVLFYTAEDIKSCYIARRQA